MGKDGCWLLLRTKNEQQLHSRNNPQRPPFVGAGLDLNPYHRCNPCCNNSPLIAFFYFIFKMADGSKDPEQFSEKVIEYNVRLCGDLWANLEMWLKFFLVGFYEPTITSLDLSKVHSTQGYCLPLENKCGA